MEEHKDERLWRIARLRANFKKSFYSYLIVNGFLWCIWWFTTGEFGNAYLWPIWPMLGWGLGLGFQYFNAYTGSGEDLTQQEYEKLKKEKES